MSLKILSLIFIAADLINGQNIHNACSSLEGYFSNRSSNPDCWYDPEVNMTLEQRAEFFGFSLEEHTVKTEDGYILVTFRLKSLSGFYGKDVIFLQHGMSTDATSFMVNKDNSIAFFLARQGFDVWLGNHRGCDRCKHERLSDNDPKYWDFSYHEHGLYDLSANFKYVRGKTKRKIIYIGHSMGGTSMGIYASMKSKQAHQYIKHAILIAPSFYMRHTKGVASKNRIDRIYQIIRILPMLNVNVWFNTGSFEKAAFVRFCLSSLENAKSCMTFIEDITGEFRHPIEWEKLYQAISAAKPICLKEMHHYAQAIRTGKYRMFDYGIKDNLVRYQSKYPPDYNLTDITIPISMIYCTTDYLIPKEDALYAFETYGKANWDIHEIPHNHIDFLFLNIARKTILPLLLKLINKHLK